MRDGLSAALQTAIENNMDVVGLCWEMMRDIHPRLQRPKYEKIIGHRYIDRFSFVEDKVEELVRELIGSKPYVDFLVGRDGDFDQIVSSTVLRVKKRVFDANSSLIWVMPYETAEYRDNVESFEKYYDEVELCQESASGHFKGAIQKRNRYMVDRVDLLICYVEKESGGAYQTMQYAITAGKKAINISFRNPTQGAVKTSSPKKGPKSHKIRLSAFLKHNSSTYSSSQ